MARRGADILFTDLARWTLATADPWKDRNSGSRFGAGVRTHTFYAAGDLVTKRERQCAAGADVEFLGIAEKKKTILHVQVGVADAAPLNTN